MHFSKKIEKYNIIKQIGSSPRDKPVYGTTYLNPLIIIPNGDTIKCVIDARHLNSNTEQSDESWPIEAFAPQLARANKKYKSAIDLMHIHTSMKTLFCFHKRFLWSQRTPKLLYKTNVYSL